MNVTIKNKLEELSNIERKFTEEEEIKYNLLRELAGQVNQ